MFSFLPLPEPYRHFKTEVHTLPNSQFVSHYTPTTTTTLHFKGFTLILFITREKSYVKKDVFFLPDPFLFFFSF